MSFFCLCNRSSLSTLSRGSTDPQGDASPRNCLISDGWGSRRADARARQEPFCLPVQCFPPSQLISETLARQKERRWLPHAQLVGRQSAGSTVACPRGGENKALVCTLARSLQHRCPVRHPPHTLHLVVTLLLF